MISLICSESHDTACVCKVSCIEIRPGMLLYLFVFSERQNIAEWFFFVNGNSMLRFSLLSGSLLKVISFLWQTMNEDEAKLPTTQLWEIQVSILCVTISLLYVSQCHADFLSDIACVRINKNNIPFIICIHLNLSINKINYLANKMIWIKNNKIKDLKLMTIQKN